MIAPDYADTPEHLREELADAQGALLDILRDLGLDACPVAEARGAVGRAVQAIREERDASRAEIQRLQSSPAPVGGGVPKLTSEEIIAHFRKSLPVGAASADDDEKALEWCFKDSRWGYSLAASRLPALKKGVLSGENTMDYSIA